MRGDVAVVEQEVAEESAVTASHVEAGPLPLSQLIERLGLALLAVGVLGRLGRYLLRFPIWGDEAMICLNFLDRDFLGLTRQLDHSQVAPILFLWAQAAMVNLFGGAEWTVRLLPLLAGTLALVVFCLLARATVGRLAAMLAVGLLACGRWPVSMSSFAKPYSFDLLMSLALLTPAVMWLSRPDRLRWLWLLAIIGPVAMAASYPAVFVAGGVAAALGWDVWRQGRAAVLPFGFFLALTGASFLGCLLLVGREPMHEGASDVLTFMQEYWAHGFPPASIGSFATWFGWIHAGRMMAYPVGGSNGASVLTTILFVVGIGAWWRTGKRTLLVLALVPFALNLAAAALRRFPYGGCCRLSQHLAPAICLLAGSGLAVLLERWTRTVATRRRAVWISFGVLSACGVGGLLADVTTPYRDKEALWSREVVYSVMKQARPQDQVVVLNEQTYVWPLLQWNLRQCGARVAWNGEVDWNRLQSSGGRLWCLDLWISTADAPRPTVEALLRESPHLLEVAAHAPYALFTTRPDPRVFHCDLYLCVRPEVAADFRRHGHLPCSP